MSDLTVHTRPAIDIPLAIVALGLTLLLAISARGSLADRPSTATATPLISSAPSVAAPVAPAAPAPAKEKGKGHD